MATAELVDIGTLIESIPGVYGGLPRLARTGLPIIQLVAELRGGETIEQVIDEYGLDQESGYAGLAFYLANKATLDQQLDERNALGARMAAEALPAQREWQARMMAKNARK